MDLFCRNALSPPGCWESSWLKVCWVCGESRKVVVILPLLKDNFFPREFLSAPSNSILSGLRNDDAEQCMPSTSQAYACSKLSEKV